MAKSAYIGIGETSRKVKNIYVGVNGVARKVKKGYIGVNGVARQFFPTPPPAPLYQLGKDWWEASVPNSNTDTSGYSCQAVVYGDNRFIAISSSPSSKKVRYSVDGTAWYDLSTKFPASSSDIVSNGYYLDNTFLIPIGPYIYRSTNNGSTWASSKVADTNNVNSLVYGNGKIVALGATTSKYSTNQGGTWVNCANTSSANLCAAFGNSKFIALGSASNGSYSTDGNTWTKFTSFPHKCTDLIFAGGKFVATSATDKTISYSYDGLTWYDAVTSETGFLKIAYGDGIYLVTKSGSSNTILYSTNAVNWSEVTVPVKAAWRGVAFGNHTFVIYNNSSTTQHAIFSRASGPASN